MTAHGRQTLIACLEPKNVERKCHTIDSLLLGLRFRNNRSHATCTFTLNTTTELEKMVKPARGFVLVLNMMLPSLQSQASSTNNRCCDQQKLHNENPPRGIERTHMSAKNYPTVIYPTTRDHRSFLFTPKLQGTIRAGRARSVDPHNRNTQHSSF